jgi:hypothetical protein
VAILAALSITASIAFAAGSAPEAVSHTPLHGWAARLNPSTETGLSRRLYGKDAALIKLDKQGGDPTFLFTKHFFIKAYELLFKATEQAVIEKTIDHTTAWKDTAPR